MTNRSPELPVSVRSGGTLMSLVHSLFVSARMRAAILSSLSLMAMVLAGAAGTKW
jgi:hypothetical protein